MQITGRPEPYRRPSRTTTQIKSRPDRVAFWAVLLGVSNCAFPLALTMVGMRARTGAGVAQLSAFAQSTGYLISIPGPLLVGVLYQHSGGWGLPIALMVGLMIPQMAVGVLAGRDRTVEDEAAR